MPDTNPNGPQDQDLNWWHREDAITVPEVDAQAARKTADAIYKEGTEMRLVTDLDDKERKRRTPINKPFRVRLINTVAKIAAEENSPVEPKQGQALVALVEGRESLETPYLAHTTAVQFYEDTFLVRLAVEWNFASMIAEWIKKRAKEDLAAGRTDPAIMAACKRIEAVEREEEQRQALEDQKLGQARSSVEKERDHWKQVAEAQAEQLRALQREVARLATQPAGALDGSPADPNRRGTPR